MPTGQVAGGPMYYIINGMVKSSDPLASFFAFSGVLVALLGMGTFTQVNAITSSIEVPYIFPLREWELHWRS